MIRRICIGLIECGGVGVGSDDGGGEGGGGGGLTMADTKSCQSHVTVCHEQSKRICVWCGELRITANTFTIFDYGSHFGHVLC